MTDVLKPSLFLLAFSCAFAWGGDKVKLKDVSTLTLYQGRRTTGRRSAPIPQLNCVGGSAGCSVQQPQTVQCYNKGTDGYDVQWECKAEMDSRYKFGATDVVCEGYDYPDDPYILKGSCGLEYTLDHQSGAGGSSGGFWKSSFEPTINRKSNSMGNLIGLAIIALVIYAIYKTCLTSHQYSTTQTDYPDDSHRSSSFGGFFGGRPSSAPPPYPETNYFPGAGASSNAGCSQQQSGGASGTTRFFQGMMSGGVLGYLFGNRNQGSSRSSHYGYGRTNDHYGYGRTSGYGSSNQSSNSGSSTYTSTGFAGTRRR